jgi:hypothetical protein
LTSEPARDNDPVRVLDREIWSTVFEDEPNEAVRVTVRPLNSEVVMESELLSVLSKDMCSTNVEDEPRRLVMDLAKPLVSKPVSPREPARDLIRVT